MEESHLPQSNAHHYQRDPHHNPAILHPAEGEDENHHEKKSVLKKVKAKAKKIKNTLTKHGHNDDHDHNHGHEVDEEEYEDEEMVEDPEVHGAPIYESAAVRSAVTVPIGQPWTNLERPSITSEDRYDSKVTDPPVKPFNQWKEKDFEKPQGKLSGGLTAMDAMDHVPKFATGDMHGKDEERNKTGLPTVEEYSTGKNVIWDEKILGGQIGKIGTNTGMEEDPLAPNMRNVTSHVQVKTTDPSGRGSEVAPGITPILRSFGKMGIDDDAEQKSKAEEGGLYTGSHDQFAPEPLQLRQEKQDSVPKSYSPSYPEDLPRDTLTGNPSSQSSNYAEKLTSAATTLVGSAKSAKHAVASKLGYGGNESATAPHQQVHSEADTEATSGADYAHKIAASVTETLAPVYGKVAGAGSTIVSKMQGTGTGADSEGQDRGVLVTEYLAEKLKPGEEDKALSELITGSSVKHKGEIGKTTNTGEEVPTGGGRGVKEDIMDAFHKREPEGKNNEKPMGKVTESEKVAKRLGTGGGEEGEKVAQRLGFSGGEAGGKGMVGWVKDAVGSWLVGKGEDTETTPGDYLCRW